PGANRAGSGGRLLPGVEWKLEPAPGISQGARLVVSGPHVMRGYVSDTGALEPPPAGWHDTGDIVRIDADGFCTIIGRLKRFAKIGGETVSLSAVESYAASAWPDHIHAAVALPDARKGERIVLFSDKADASPSELLAWAHRHGAPEIAVPKKIVALAAIPVLGTGKIDYAALQRQAEEGAGAAEAA
ncbi:MAG: 2-acylglycerophosphoethanolamine acyltransferase, partial [Hyphomonadaceae bacterium]